MAACISFFENSGIFTFVVITLLSSRALYSFQLCSDHTQNNENERVAKCDELNWAPPCLQRGTHDTKACGKWHNLQDGYAWIFLEPNIQTSHIHHH